MSGNDFGFRLELVDGFTKLVPIVFGHFIGHHRQLFECTKSACFLFLLIFFVFYNFTKIPKLMPSNQFKRERYKRKYNIIKKNRIKKKRKDANNP